MLNYVDGDFLQFCMKNQIKIDPREHAIFLRKGLVEVSRRYDQHSSRDAAMNWAMQRLIKILNEPIDPRVGVYNRIQELQRGDLAHAI